MLFFFSLHQVFILYRVSLAVAVVDANHFSRLFWCAAAGDAAVQKRPGCRIPRVLRCTAVDKMASSARCVKGLCDARVGIKWG